MYPVKNVPYTLSAEELLEALNGCRAENHQPDRGEDEKKHRDHHLHRSLLGLFLRTLSAFNSHLLRLNPENPADTDTPTIAIDDNNTGSTGFGSGNDDTIRIDGANFRSTDPVTGRAANETRVKSASVHLIIKY